MCCVPTGNAYRKRNGKKVEDLGLAEVFWVYQLLATQRSDKLHSVEGSWDNGVCHGLQTFNYCNGVTFKAAFDGGVAQSLAVGFFKEKVIFAGKYVDGCLVGNFCAIEPDGGSLLTGYDWT